MICAAPTGASEPLFFLAVAAPKRPRMAAYSAEELAVADTLATMTLHIFARYRLSILRARWRETVRWLARTNLAIAPYHCALYHRKPSMPPH